MRGIGKSLQKKYDEITSEKHIETLAVLETVVNYPCLQATKIAEQLEAKQSTVRWYLRKLEGKKLIVSVRIGGKILYYGSDFVIPEDVEDLALLQNPDMHTILARVANAHGISKRGILESIPMEQPSKAYVYIQHLENLTDKGFVRVLKDKKMNYYYLTDKLFQLYKKYAEREGKVCRPIVRKLNTILPEVQPGATATLKEMNFKEGGMLIIITSPINQRVQIDYKLRLNPLWSYQEIIQPE
ncbi:MAG: hypothetical protein QXH13_00535 [Thermoplasmata archaeon]